MRLSELNLNPGETLTIQIGNDGLTATIKLADREFNSELRFETRAENDNATMFDGCLETVRASIDYRHLNAPQSGVKARDEMDTWKDETPVTVTMTVPNWVAKHIADEVVRLKETPR